MNREPKAYPVVNPLNDEIIGRTWSATDAAKIARIRLSDPEMLEYAELRMIAGRMYWEPRYRAEWYEKHAFALSTSPLCQSL